jgi:hypothetical protein
VNKSRGAAWTRRMNQSSLLYYFILLLGKKNNKSLGWAHIIKIGLVIVLLYLRPPARWNQTYASTATSVGEARSTFPTSFPPSPTVLHRAPRTSHSQANRGGDICTCITGLVGSYLPPPWLAKSGCCKPGFGDVTSSTVSGEPGPRCFEDCVSLVPHLHVGNQTSILDSREAGSNNQTRNRYIS